MIHSVSDNHLSSYRAPQTSQVQYEGKGTHALAHDLHARPSEVLKTVSLSVSHVAAHLDTLVVAGREDRLGRVVIPVQPRKRQKIETRRFPKTAD